MKVVILRGRVLQNIGFALCAAALCLIVLYAARPAAIPALANAGNGNLPVYSVKRDDKKVAISFDAAWGEEKTLKILDILDECQVRTTFFLVGFWIDRYPEQVKQIAARGHEIGNHSSTHPHMPTLTPDQMKMELSAASETITALTGRAVELFRPPYGEYNDELLSVCRAQGYTPIQWSVDSLDWKDLSAEAVIRQVVNKAASGSIILFHNNSKTIEQALPAIIKKLNDKGYIIVPVSELLLEGDTAIDRTGAQYSVAG